MKESLLQYIWQYQYFNAGDLRTTTGEVVQVLSPGRQNTDQGPDFLDARIRIGATQWVGAVELHVAASDWDRHAHRTDQHYRNVILHVAWRADGSVQLLQSEEGFRVLPTLVLEGRVPGRLLEQYASWMKSRDFVACQGQLALVEEHVRESWKRQLMQERLLRKAGVVRAWLGINQGHWEETCWWLMARTMGGVVNAASFEMIARSLPLSLLARQGGKVETLEALLLGVGGLLEEDGRDDRLIPLRREFDFLRKKHRLAVIPGKMSFLRMRPASFPDRRLAQLAALIAAGVNWFSRARDAAGPDELKRFLNGGNGMKDSLLINTFIPMLYAYGLERGEASYQEKAYSWLMAVDAERNVITRGWAGLGIGCKHGGDSQALLELKTRYCQAANCLQCAIGRRLLKGPYPS